jgi:hypothetical protein
MRALVVIAICSGLMAGAAHAQAPSPVAADVRCLLTMAALTANKNNQPAAYPGIYFFAGRIKAREPAFDFATRLKPVAAAMTQAEFEAEAKRCGPVVIEMLKGMQAAQQSFGPPPAAAAAPAPK